MKKISLFLLVSFWCAFFAVSQIKGREVTVMVSPDHADWLYQPGEQCAFTVQVFKAQNLLSDVTVDYEVGPEMFPTESKKGVVLKDGKIMLQGKMQTSGFLRCKVKAYVDNRTYEGLATVGYSPEKLVPVTSLPADFRDFWNNSLAEVRQTSLQPRMTLLPERCTDTDNVYEVNYQVDKNQSRFYGILSVPKAPGTYPALLRVPGAGARPYSGDAYTAPGKLITLEIGIHGVPVTFEPPFYNNLMAGPLNCYWTFSNDDAKRFYYHRVVMGALRGVDLICQLPEYNGKALGVTGSSQGGALSVITAALDPRVTFYAAIHPALCDHEGFLEGRAGGWPHYLYYDKKAEKTDIQTVRYYDVANFARFITVPGWFSWGYNDEVCSPTSMYAAFNSINAPKDLSLYHQAGHYWYEEQYEEWQNKIRTYLGLAD